MKTVVFVIRHSESFRDFFDSYNVSDNEQIRNEKNPLSVNGERKAKELSNYSELKDISTIYSSHYVRAMATAKYIAENNKLKLNIDFRLGERRFGVKSMSKLPGNFCFRQLENWNYKLFGGESLNQVSKRMRSAFMDILKKNLGSKIVIVSHGTAITTLFDNWCDIKINYATELAEISYGNKLIFDGNWSAPEVFKLEFDDLNLTSICNIKIN